MQYRGHAVTPFLTSLQAEGAASANAYANSAFTAVSRGQLFSGSVAPRMGEPTLIDDFSERGYEVAYFSGQDDSFMDGDRIIGADEIDNFFDARQAKARRTSRSSQPVSLQVSWKVVLEQLDRYLGERQSQAPLFLYVNLVDSHFPYDHAELESILPVERAGREAISADNAEQVWGTYLNAVANVDRAVQAVVERFRAHVGADHAIVVTADHGEEIYDHGFLGHGRLTRLQTRVPLILYGVGGDWPEPIGVADLRGQLRRNLFQRNGPTRFVPDPERRIAQVTPFLDRPRQFGLRGLDVVEVYEFDSDRVYLGEPGLVAGVPSRQAPEPFRRLIWSWEGLRSD